MLYDKKRYEKVDDKKVLHKVKKHWVVMSAALLMALGGGAAVTHTNAHAATNDNNGNNDQNEKTQTGTQTQKAGTAGSTLVSAHQTFGPQSPQKTQPTQSSASAGQPTQQKPAQVGAQNPNQGSSTGSQASHSAQLTPNQIIAQAKKVHVRVLDNNIQNTQKHSLGATIQRPRHLLGDSSNSGNFYTNPYTFSDASDNNTPDGTVNLGIKFIDVDPSDNNFNNVVNVNSDIGEMGSDESSDNITSYGYHPDVALNNKIGIKNFTVSDAKHNKYKLAYKSKGILDIIHSVKSLSDSTLESVAQDPDTENYYYGIGVVPVNASSDISHNSSNSGTNTSSNTNQSNMGTILIRYLNADNNDKQFSTSDHSSDSLNDHPFDLSGVIANRPSDYFNIYSDNELVKLNPNNKTYYQVKVEDANHNVKYYWPNYSDGTPSQSDSAPKNIPYQSGTQKVYIPVIHNVNMRIVYHDEANNNKPLMAYTTNGGEGNPFTFNSDQYEDVDVRHNFPNYYFDKVGNIPKYFTNNGQVDIYLHPKGTYVPPSPKPNTSSDTMNFIYMNEATNSAVRTYNNVSGADGSSISSDVNKYMPNGFTYNKILYGPSKFTNGGSVYIGVNHEQSMPNTVSDTMTFNYSDSTGKHVRTVSNVKGTNGSSVISDVDEYMPNGYTYNKIASGPSTFTNNGTVDVDVTSNQPTPTPTPSTMSDNMTFNYTDDSDNKSLNTIVNVKGTNGSSFMSDVNKNIPNGYQLDKIISSPNTTNTFTNNGTVNIGVKKPAHTITVNYIDGNGTPQRSVKVYGPDTATFDSYAYEHDVPSDYDFVNPMNNVPSNFNSNATFNVRIAKKSSDGQITISYADTSNNNNVFDTITTSGTDKEPFNAMTYLKDLLPAGYELSHPTGNDLNGLMSSTNGKNPSNYIAGQNQTDWTIYVKPIPKAPNLITMQVYYSNEKTSNHETIGDPINVTGASSQPFDITPYEDDVPNGYHVDYVAMNELKNSSLLPNEFTMGLHNKQERIPILVAPNTPANVTIPVTYMSNGNKVSSDQVMGATNSIFNANLYINNVPSGYQFDKVEGSEPQTFDPNQNQSLTIDVTPVDTMTVQYINDKNGKQVGSNVTVSGKDGSSFDPSDYENNVPNGYTYDPNGTIREPSSGNFSPDGTVKIPVTQDNAATKHITIYYDDEDNNYTKIGSDIAYGSSDQQFDIRPYEKIAPYGYKVDQTSTNYSPMNYNDGSVTINVKKVNTINVNYKNGNNIVGTTTLKGLNGSYVDTKQYKNDIPSGYSYVSGLDDHTPTTFNGDQTIDVQVDKNATMTIRYYNVATHTADGSDEINGIQNDSINPLTYEKNIPGNNKFVDLKGYSNNEVPKFNNGHTLTVDVTPIESSDVVVPIYYFDKEDNHQINELYGVAKIGTKFINTEYIHDIPSDFTYDSYESAKSPDVFKKGQSFTIYVTKDLKPVKMTLIYETKSGQQIGDPVTVQGMPNQEFKSNDSAYLNNIPSDYHVIDSSTVPNDYTNGGPYIIRVAKNAPSTMTVEYVDKNKPVGPSFTVAGSDNTTFNVQPYEADVPADYTLANNGVPNTVAFVNGHTVKIPVTKNPNLNTITINYKDPKTGSDVGNVVAKGASDQNFQIVPYTKMVPSGYTFSQIDSNYIPQKYDNGSVTIDVDRDNSQPILDTMTINYNTSDGYKNGQKAVNSIQVQGADANDFSVKPYTQLMPSDYYYTGSTYQNAAVPSKFNNNNNVINLVVAKKAQNAGVGTITVKYRDAHSDKQVGKSVVTTGENGSTFEASDYENDVPSNYASAGVDGPVPTKYESNQQQTLIVNVTRAAAPAPSDVTVPVVYEDQSDNNNQVGNTVNVVGKPYTPFSLHNSDVPSGYQYVIGMPRKFPNNGDQINVLVKKIAQQKPVNPAKPTATVTIQYLDNGNNVGTEQATGNVGSDINQQQYKEYVPSGFTFKNIEPGAPTTYQANGDIKIDVTKDQNETPVTPTHNVSDAKMTIDYETPGNDQPFSSFNVYGKPSTEFSDEPYLHDVPQGFTYAGVDSANPTTYQDGKHVIIYVRLQHTPQTATITINYMDGNNIIDTATATGMSDQPFTAADLRQYEMNVPSGYAYNNGNVNAPSKFTNTSFTIPVNKLVSSDVQIPVTYYNSSDHNKIMNTLVATGKRGNPFKASDVRNYESDVPQGYDFNGTEGNPPLTYQDGESFNIYVTKATQPQAASMTIDYRYNGNPVGTATVNGTAGSQFTNSDLQQYTNDVPQGYKYDNGSINAPRTYQNGTEFDIPVDPITSSDVQIPVKYMDVSDNQQVGNVITTTGKNSDSFVASDYTNDIPKGYQFVKVDGSTPQNYLLGKKQHLTVDVAKVNQPQAATMTIDYLDQSNHNKQIGNGLTVNGHIGDSFDVSPYTQTLPAGYQFSNNGNNVLDNATKFTEPSHTIDIMVTPIPKNTQPAYATMPITYVDRKSGHKIDSTSAVGAVGTQFKSDQYKANVPSGYRFTPNDSVSYSGNYANGQSVTIYVDPIDTTTNHNNDNNNSSSNNGSNNGNNANATPSTHHSGDNGNQNNGQNPTQSMGSITVNYADDKSGQTVSDDKFTVSDVVGKPFNDAPFVDNIPQGYSFDRVDESNKPEQYTSDPQTLTIYVSKKPVTVKPNPTNNSNTTNNSTTTNSSNTSNNGGSTNAAKRQTMGTITINYLDQANSNPIGDTVTVSDVAGHNFTIAPYEHNLPAGYHNGRLVGTAPNEFTDGNQNVYITVTQNRKAAKPAKPARRASKAAHVEKDAKMTIQYVHNGQSVGTPSNATAVGQPGTELNMIPYEMDVPTGYRYNNGAIQEDGVTIDRPVTFEDGQTVTVEVEPIDTNADHRHTAAAAVNNNGSNNDEDANANSDAVSDEGNSLIQIPVSYYWYDPSGNLTRVGYATADGIDGQYFDRLNQFVDNVPDGFVNGRVMGNPPMKYANNEQLNILVSKKHPKVTTSPVKTNDQDQGANKNKSVNNGNNGNPQIVNMMITYMNNGNVVGNTATLNGYQGHLFSIAPYLTVPNVPEGYHYSGNIIDNTDTYDAGHQIVVVVAPNNPNNSNNSGNENNNNQSNDDQPTSSKVANMTVAYVSNGYSVGTRNITGITGNPFDVTPYEIDVPGGYQNGTAVISPDEYKNGGYVEIKVQPVDTNNNGGNQQNFSGNGHSNNSGSRSAKGNASNGQPSNPTNTYSPNYEPNYDPTVIVYPNGQESSVNKNGSSTGSGSGSGSGGHPKTNRGANTDPNHEQNNNGSASDQKQNSANANQPNGKKDRGSQTANNGKATSGGNATNSKGGSSSNPGGGIVINNNPVNNNNVVNGSGGGSSSGTNGSSNHSSQSTNGDNHSPNSQPNQNTPNDDSGSTGNHQSQSQSQTVNVNGGSTNGGGTNHASQPSNGSATNSSTGQGSNAANGSNGGSTNNFNPSNTNSGNNQQSQSGSINGNGGSGSSTNGNGSKANGTDQNDSTVDSIMSRQDSVIASLASQVASKGSNGSTNSTTNNYDSSTIASLSSEITSVENSINSKGTGQNGAGGNTGSQGSQASGNASGNNAGGNPSPSTASNGSTSTASNSELNSLNSTINSLEKRMNNQSSGPTTVNNYYGNGGSNNSSALSNGYQPATNNFSPSFNPSVINNVPTPNSGNSTTNSTTTNSSNDAQPNGNNSGQQTPSTDTNQKVSRRRTQSTHRNTRSRDRNGGSKKRTGRVSRRHSRATTNRKASSDIEYRPVNGDQLFNYGDRNGFSNGNHVGQRNSRGTSLIINGRHDRFGDRFADTLHNKHASFAVDHDHTTGQNRRRLAQTGEANNTREFKMLGSILLAVGAGLSQMGASFKRRRRRRHFELDRRYNRYKN